jgi:hypothetical protein
MVCYGASDRYNSKGNFISFPVADKRSQLVVGARQQKTFELGAKL